MSLAAALAVAGGGMLGLGAHCEVKHVSCAADQLRKDGGCGFLGIWHQFGSRHVGFLYTPVP